MFLSCPPGSERLATALIPPPQITMFVTGTNLHHLEMEPRIEEVPKSQTLTPYAAPVSTQRLVAVTKVPPET